MGKMALSTNFELLDMLTAMVVRGHITPTGLAALRLKLAHEKSFQNPQYKRLLVEVLTQLASRGGCLRAMTRSGLTLMT